MPRSNDSSKLKRCSIPSLTCFRPSERKARKRPNQFASIKAAEGMAGLNRTSLSRQIVWPPFFALIGSLHYLPVVPGPKILEDIGVRRIGEATHAAVRVDAGHRSMMGGAEEGLDK